jgi:dienelactone hydrolase
MRKPVTIWSEGTRLAGDLFTPEEAGANDKLPTILLCHGWGGLKQHLSTTYAPWWSKSGFVTLTFDYRGWGESDAKLIPSQDSRQSRDQNEITVKTRAVREVVDPFDQIRDISACLDFLEGEAIVDAERIGLWGSSYGGGHVAYMAAHDARVKAVVAQVGAQQPFGGIFEAGRARAIARARGQIGPIPPHEDATPGLGGVPDLAKMIRYRPIDTADKIRVPTLVIDAAQEELFDRMQNGHRLFEIVSKNAPARYETFPGKHYEIYDKYYHPASNLARDWFLEHLKKG